MQNQFSLAQNVRILVVMPPSEERQNLLKNIQKSGCKAETASVLPDILRKLNHADKYDVMFIPINPSVDNSELISFIRSGVAGKSPYLIGLSSGLTELQQNIYLRFGGIDECIQEKNNQHQIIKTIQKVHQKKQTNRTSNMPRTQKKRAIA